jgi:carboxypeptidase Taq
MTKGTETLKNVYDKLMDKTKEITILESAASILHWDMETKMPPKGITLRSQQMAMLRQIDHRMTTNPEIGAMLEKIRGHSDYESLDKVQKRNVYLVKKHYDEMTKLPEELVVETARQQTVTIDTWKKAKAAKDFSMFKPELEKLVELRKKAAQILMTVKKTVTPYDALIDIFEPKATSKMITETFNELKKGLISIIKKCETAPKQPDISIIRRKIPIELQKKISNSLAKFVDYDIDSKEAGGRIDETEHPFTTGYYDDVRITTHYYEKKFTSSVFSVLHEAGHAIYEQNLKQEWIYQPVGTACSSGFHECQSRFVENIIGRSPEFWTYYFPKLEELIGAPLSNVTLDKFVHAVNRVKPSKIRVEADEVTYSLHIIIRFEIEQQLIAGKIAVADLPQIWNQKYKEYLGLDIENDSEGVMQDIHWSGGSFGYFPSYALGNVYSGQLLNTMEKNIPDWRKQLSEGKFHSIKQWLDKNPHTHRNLHDPTELIKKISGESLNVKHYLNYVDKKYSKLYGY